MMDASYFALVQAFPLVPIKDEKMLDEAIKVIDSLVIKPEMDSGESQYLAVLSFLVHDYEKEHDKSKTTGAEMLSYLMADRKMSAEELGKAVGLSRATILMLSKGKRLFTVQSMEKLGKYFSVNPTVFWDRK